MKQVLQVLWVHGRTVIAILILFLSAVVGEADLSTLEGFLENAYANAGVSVTAIAALVTHYFGDVWIGKQPEEEGSDE